MNIFSILTESNDSKAITPITDLSRSLLQKLFKVHIIIAIHVVAACKLKVLVVGGFEQNFTGKACHWVNPESHLHAHVYMYVHV